jgi:ABC-type phosphate transport system permease subunit
MKNNNLYYFKKGLLLILPIAIFTIIKGLFDVGFSDFYVILKLLAKGVFVGIFTGIILGLFNIFAKIDTFMKKE